MKHYGTAKIISQKQLSSAYFLLTLECPEIACTASPGQFVMISCGGQTYLKRPMGLSGANAKHGTISFIYQKSGTGTHALHERKEDEDIEIIGPLGNCFELESGAKSVALVGGGTGIGPLLFCAERMSAEHPEAALSAFIGARSKKILCGEEEIGHFARTVYVATDDGSYGEKGLITDALSRFLKENALDQIITCGPTVMMQKVAEISAHYHISCQASLEEHMACGFGACLGCPCTVKDEGYKMICLDGPVFDAAKIVWKKE